jgi:DNA-binding Xre family transcriptional regulator
VETIRERLERIMKSRGWTRREWARIAKIPENSVNVALGRSTDEKAGIGVVQLGKLCSAAHISIDWVVYGQGEPIRLEPDPMYPTRTTALAAAFLSGQRLANVDEILAIRDLPQDPGVSYWFSRFIKEPATSDPIKEVPAKGTKRRKK